MKKYLAIVGEDFPAELLPELKSIDVLSDVIVIPADNSITSPISTHPDTIFCIYQGKMFCHRSYYNHAEKYILDICEKTSLVPVVCKGERNGSYPFDISFNALCFDSTSTVIGKADALAEPLRADCINCNQGYAACSCVIWKDTIITADQSIKKSAKRANIGCLMLSGDGILLKGYSEGFLGGACGVIPDTAIITVGNPKGCSLGQELIKACHKLNITLIILGEKLPFSDVGGIKIIEQKKC